MFIVSEMVLSILHLILTISTEGRNDYYPHFAREETKARNIR